MQLDHVTIVAPDCAPLHRFFVQVAGMEDGARPAFGVGGHWLYLNGRPVLHLIERPDALSGPRIATPRPQARIDHVALRLGSAAEWRALLRRLDAYAVPYQLSDMRALQEQQLFVALAPGVTVEFVIAGRHLG
jgi:catechol 2,3-dioxygenase-like lactoylglutathione lyase family enzyme